MESRIISHLKMNYSVFTSAGRVKVQKNGNRQLSEFPLHHTNTFTVRTYPGRAITDSPLVLFKAVLADHETTGTTPAKLLSPFAAMANIGPDFSFSVTLFMFFYRHCCTSP
jgi:hypothetical protein